MTLKSRHYWVVIGGLEEARHQIWLLKLQVPSSKFRKEENQRRIRSVPQMKNVQDSSTIRRLEFYYGFGRIKKKFTFHAREKLPWTSKKGERKMFRGGAIGEEGKRWFIF